MTAKPDAKPARPWFSAGPTAKRPGWSLAGLPTNLLGRGIRAPEVAERFAYGLKLTREVLAPPEDYVLLYTPGSDTGAVEAALSRLEPAAHTIAAAGRTDAGVQLPLEAPVASAVLVNVGSFRWCPGWGAGRVERRPGRRRGSAVSRPRAAAPAAGAPGPGPAARP